MKKMSLMNRIIYVATVLMIVLFSCKKDKKTKKNVLLISVDDLRPELNVYGNNQIHSPNIDKLAKNGVVFNKAYCQSAICMPSRTSFLSGVRPENFNSTGRLNANSLEENGLDVVTMPRLFKANGYQTVSIGKIYHHDGEDSSGWTRRYGPVEEFGGIGYESGYYDEHNRSIVDNYLNAWADKALWDSARQPSVEMVEKQDSSTPDGRVRNLAIS